MGTPERTADRTAEHVSGVRVQSVERAAALLDAVAAASPRGDTAAELALACGINRATAWRLLATLEGAGLVDRDPATNRYQIGYTVARLAAASGVDGLVRRTHHVLERICAQTGEAADLAVGRRSGLVYVDEVAPPAVLTVNWLARPVPLHATSTGKAWLAWLPEVEARGVLGPVLEGFTDATVTDVARLLGELGQVREQGYAVSLANSSPRCAVSPLRCCSRARTGRSRCSASGVRPTGCPRHDSPRSARSPSRPPRRSRRPCATDGLAGS